MRMKFPFLIILIILLMIPLASAAEREDLIDVNILDIYLGPDNLYLLKVEVTNTLSGVTDVNVILSEAEYGGVAGSEGGNPQDIVYIAEILPDTNAILSYDDQEIDLLDMEPNEKRIVYVELNSFFATGQSTMRITGTAGADYDEDDVDVAIDFADDFPGLGSYSILALIIGASAVYWRRIKI